MANIKQQKKRILTDKKKKSCNHAFKSQIRVATKKVRLAIQAQDSANLSQKVNHLIKLLDKSLTKKIHKTNFVKRHKSQILKQFHLFNQTLTKEKQN